MKKIHIKNYKKSCSTCKIACLLLEKPDFPNKWAKKAEFYKEKLKKLASEFKTAPEISISNKPRSLQSNLNEFKQRIAKEKQRIINNQNKIRNYNNYKILWEEEIQKRLVCENKINELNLKLASEITFISEKEISNNTSFELHKSDLEITIENLEESQKMSTQKQIIIENITKNIISQENYEKMNNVLVNSMEKHFNEDFCNVIKLFDKKILLLQNEKQFFIEKCENQAKSFENFIKDIDNDDNSAKIIELILENQAEKAVKLINQNSNKQISDLTRFLQCQASLIEEINCNS